MTRTDRFPGRKELLPPVQQAAYEQIEARRGRVPAPYLPLLGSPGVADAFERFSTALWDGVLTRDLQEAIFLVAARAYRCEHQWHTHEPRALAAGVPASTIAAMKADRVPDTEEAGARLAAVIRFASVLYAQQSVPRDVFDDVAARLGGAQLSELIAFCALATSISLLVNVREVPSST